MIADWAVKHLHKQNINMDSMSGLDNSMDPDQLVSLSGSTVKPVLSGHSKRRPKLVFKTAYRLMQVKSIAECSNGSILQYFRPSLSYHLSL